MTSQNKPFLALECFVLFAALPIILFFLPPKGVLFATLWVLTIGCLVVLKKKYNIRFRDSLKFNAFKTREFKRVLLVFSISAIMLTGYTHFIEPSRLLAFVSERPYIWAFVMIGYPLVSVFPQEIIYRLFFFERYAPLFKSDWIMVFMSGLAFGHAHIIFQNVVAYVLSVIGGWIFAYTYMRTKSYSLVWFEHAIYGNFLFTIGLGWYFYSGAIGNH